MEGIITLATIVTVHVQCSVQSNKDVEGLHCQLTIKSTHGELNLYLLA